MSVYALFLVNLATVLNKCLGGVCFLLRETKSKQILLFLELFYK